MENRVEAAKNQNLNQGLAGAMALSTNGRAVFFKHQ
jgi:hypothetical protein